MFGVWDLGISFCFLVPGLEVGIHCLRLMVLGFGFEDEGLGFGVWGLEFGI